MNSARVLALFCLTACAGTPYGAPSTAIRNPQEAFRVAIMGDMPYHDPAAPDRDSIMAAYRAVLDTIAAEPVAFVVHVGDFTGATCSDSLYTQRLSEFSAMPHPFFLTFGDNEWTDCWRNGFDAVGRLAKLRDVFTQGDRSLGRRSLALERQSAEPRYASFRENVRWRVGDILFLTLHVVGSNNNRGPLAAPSAEFTARTEANIAWLRDAFARAAREGIQGVAIFMQANPTMAPLARGGGAPPPSGFTEIMAEFGRLAAGFGGHVAIVHGDTHTFRVEQSLRDAQGRIRTNVTRAETYGNPSFHALILNVHPGTASVFRFEPLVVLKNRSF